MNLFDIFFPKRCVSCWRIGRYFCSICARGIRTIGLSETICPVCEKPAIDGITHPRCTTRYSLDGLTSFFRYTGPTRKAIKAIKYRYVSNLAEEFTGCVPSDVFLKLYALHSKPCILVPIPLHPSRLRDRGFNQAEVLGRLLAKQLHIPICTDILRRTKKTVPQVEMKDRKERLHNMEHVFSVSPHICVSQYPCILLFDDVFTTGATMRGAANILKRAGVKHVWAVTMAR